MSIKSRIKKKFYAVGRSADTWHQLDFGLKNGFKEQLAVLHGVKCCKKNHFGCGKQYESCQQLEIDHIIPISMGGPVCDIGNMQLLCRDCHKLKTIKHDSRLVKIS